MKEVKTKFSKENQPKNRRGKSERTKLIEAMKRQGKNEEGFYDMLVGRAFNPNDSFAAKEILTRMYPVPKSTMPVVDFKFDETAKPVIQAAQIMKAASSGDLPPDVASTFIAAITNMMKIEEVTDLKDQLAEIKKMLGVSDV